MRFSNLCVHGHLGQILRFAQDDDIDDINDINDIDDNISILQVFLTLPLNAVVPPLNLPLQLTYGHL